jgi:hypothetical protein
MAQQLTDRDEKIAYYRKAAGEAEKSAARAGDSQTRDGFLAVMRTWIYLAEELEREIAMEEKTTVHEGPVIPPPADTEARDNHTAGFKATNKSRL